MALGLMDMNILPWEVVVESGIHLVVENFHTFVVENFHTIEVVHLGNNMEGVALGGGDVEMVVALYVVHMAHTVVVMVDMDEGHMKVVGEKWLLSVVEGHVEDMTHRHIVVVLGNHKEIHHSHLIDMHQRMALPHSALVGVVAMMIDHKHMALPTFDCPILDTHLHYSPHHLQHSCTHTHSQNENS
ncbi:hypothetical protein AHAS_Ahas11G0288900 [Arachis hypogaea]